MAGPKENVFNILEIRQDWLISVGINHGLFHENFESRSRVHERTFSLMFLGLILRVLQHEVFVYNVYIKKTLKTFVPIASKNSASGYLPHRIFILSTISTTYWTYSHVQLPYRCCGYWRQIFSPFFETLFFLYPACGTEKLVAGVVVKLFVSICKVLL